MCVCGVCLCLCVCVCVCGGGGVQAQLVGKNSENDLFGPRFILQRGSSGYLKNGAVTDYKKHREKGKEHFFY